MTKDNMTIGIIGAGTMGRGIAQIAAVAGFEVRLFDADDGTKKAALDFIQAMIKRAVEKQRMSADEAAQALGRLQPADDLAEFADCGLVIEAIVEDLAIKQSLFAQLEDIVAKDAILASNTSSLSISALAASCKSPERVAGFHFFNPVPLMRVVEVVSGLGTKPDIADKLAEIARIMGHEPVRVADSPGFLVNHAGRGYGTEALRIVAENIADVATIDLVLRDGVGFKMGPFELLDVTALDVSHPVMEQIYHQYYEEARYRPQPLTGRRLAAGLLGRKTGQGFYVYKDGKRVPQPASVPHGDGGPVQTAFVAPSSLTQAFEMLCDDLAASGVEVTDNRDAADVCVVLPLGIDCTNAALDKGLAPAKTVAVDPIGGFDDTPILSRVAVVMTNPATDKTLADHFAARLNRAGRPAVLIADSPGFIAQRVMAAIVNIGADIAQQGIASPHDIDKAVNLGLGYPKGPLELGDLLGPDMVVAVLEGLLNFYGDPRYRVSPWLKRRAALGLSLGAV